MKHFFYVTDEPDSDYGFHRTYSKFTDTKKSQPDMGQEVCRIFMSKAIIKELMNGATCYKSVTSGKMLEQYSDRNLHHRLQDTGQVKWSMNKKKAGQTCTSRNTRWVFASDFQQTNICQYVKMVTSICTSR